MAAAPCPVKAGLGGPSPAPQHRPTPAATTTLPRDAGLHDPRRLVSKAPAPRRPPAAAPHQIRASPSRVTGHSSLSSPFLHLLPSVPGHYSASRVDSHRVAVRLPGLSLALHRQWVGDKKLQARRLHLTTVNGHMWDEPNRAVCQSRLCSTFWKFL